MTAPQQRAVTGALDRLLRISLWGGVSSGFAAVATSAILDTATVLLTGAALILWAALWLWKPAWRLPGHWTSALALLCAGFYPLDYLYLSQDFVIATVRLVVLLAVLRLFAAREQRDYTQVALGGLLVLVAGALVSQQVSFLACLLAFLFCMVATLVLWELQRSLRLAGTWDSGPIRLTGPVMAVSVLFALLCVVFGAGVFLLLPRLPQVRFPNLLPASSAVQDFPGEVVLGQIGQLQRQSTVWMHVRIPGWSGPIDFRWRGDALAEFDGRRWFNPDAEGQAVPVFQQLASLATVQDRQRPGRRLNYEVRSPVTASRTLFIAGQPEFIRINAPVLVRTPEGAIRVPFPSGPRLQYGVYSLLSETASGGQPVAGVLEPGEYRRYTRLPAKLDPRIAKLARQITEGLNSPAAQARAIEAYLRAHFTYTLEPIEQETRDPVAYFLFERRSGHCEYFASAMALMLRSLGIPARVAIGFRGGTYNPLTGWYAVRASDAHSWVEAYLPGLGWTTFDPTPAATLPQSEAAWSRWEMVADAWAVFWQEWVVNYDWQRQASLATRFKRARSRWLTQVTGQLKAIPASWTVVRQSLGRLRWPVAAGAVVAATFCVALPGLWRRWQWWRLRSRAQRAFASTQDALRLYEYFLSILQRYGWVKDPSLTPAEFAARLPQTPLGELAREFTRQYQQWRYGGRWSAAQEVVRLLGQLQRQARAARGRPASLG